MTTLASRGSGTPTTAASAGTWSNATSAVDGSPGSTPDTFATWVTNVANITATITVSGYDFSTIPSGATVNSVTVLFRHSESSTARLVAVFADVFDGATQIGTTINGTTNTATHNDSAAMSANPTVAQLKSANFKVRLSATRGNVGTTSTWSVDHIDVTVDYTSSASVTASALGSWGSLTATALAVVKHPASALGAWGALTATATATVRHPATADGTWGAWSATATAEAVHAATASAAWGEWTATASAAIARAATASATWGEWTATVAATVEHVIQASAVGAWGSWYAAVFPYEPPTMRTLRVPGEVRLLTVESETRILIARPVEVSIDPDR